MRLLARMVSVGAVLVLAFVGLVAPAADATTAAACGTTTAQWTGTFEGTVYIWLFESTDPLRVVVKQGGTGPAGLTVDTYHDGHFYDGDDALTQLADGKLRWTAQRPLEYWESYEPSSVTCSDGRVAQFSGRYRTPWAGPGFFLLGDFELTRTA